MTKTPRDINVSTEWAKRYPWAKYANFCMAGNKDASFVCTREADHEGEHAAHLRPDTVVATWDEEDTRPRNREYTK